MLFECVFLERSNHINVQYSSGLWSGLTESICCGGHLFGRTVWQFLNMSLFYVNVYKSNLFMVHSSHLTVNMLPPQVGSRVQSPP